jgi:hypothetical protein
MHVCASMHVCMYHTYVCMYVCVYINKNKRHIYKRYILWTWGSEVACWGFKFVGCTGFKFVGCTGFKLVGSTNSLRGSDVAEEEASSAWHPTNSLRGSEVAFLGGIWRCEAVCHDATCIHKNICMYVYMYMYICICKHIYICMYEYVHMKVNLYIYIYMYICIYA